MSFEELPEHTVFIMTKKMTDQDVVRMRMRCTRIAELYSNQLARRHILERTLGPKHSRTSIMKSFGLRSTDPEFNRKMSAISLNKTDLSDSFERGLLPTFWQILIRMNHQNGTAHVLGVEDSNIESAVRIVDGLQAKDIHISMGSVSVEFVLNELNKATNSSSLNLLFLPGLAYNCPDKGILNSLKNFSHVSLYPFTCDSVVTLIEEIGEAKDFGSIQCIQGKINTSAVHPLFLENLSEQLSRFHMLYNIYSLRTFQKDPKPSFFAKLLHFLRICKLPKPKNSLCDELPYCIYTADVKNVVVVIAMYSHKRIAIFFTQRDMQHALGLIVSILKVVDKAPVKPEFIANFMGLLHVGQEELLLDVYNATLQSLDK